MLNRILTLESFIDLVIHRIEKLRPHSFIAREQANYLNQLKQDLTGDEVIDSIGGLRRKLSIYPTR